MSIRAQMWVWEQELPPTMKLVAIALADHAHDDGTEARPSQDLLSRKTGLDVRTVRRVIHRLVDEGVIELQRPARQNYCNVFRFPIPVDFARSDRTQRPPRKSVRPDTGASDRTQRPLPDRTQRPPNRNTTLLITNESVHEVPVVGGDVKTKIKEARETMRADRRSTIASPKEEGK